MSMTCLLSNISIYSKLILATDSKHVLHFFDSLSKLQIQSKRLVTMSASLHTQTGLQCLTIQVLNTKVCFIDILCTSLTSVYYNLEHMLAIVTDLDYTTSLVKVWIRSDATSHTFPDTVHLSCATTSKNQFELVTASLSHVISMQKDSTPQPLLAFPIFLPDGL